MINPGTRDLPSSGTIKLSEVKDEFGKGNSLLGYLGEGGVTSSAPLKLTDFYGTAASDAVPSENFGDGYLIGLHGYVNQGTSGSLDQDIIDNGENLRTGADTYRHRWPLSHDGQAHAFTAEYPSIAKNWDGDKSKPEIYSNQLPVWQPQKVGLNLIAHQRRGNYTKSRMDLAINCDGKHEGYNVTPLQRLKRGRYTFTGRVRDSKKPDAYSSWSTVTAALLQFETMTPVSSTMAQAGGATKKTQLSTVKGGGLVDFAKVVDVDYEWCFLQIYVNTNGETYGLAYQEINIYSIS